MPIFKELHAYIDGSCSTSKSAVGIVIVNPKAHGKAHRRLIALPLHIYASPPAVEVFAAIYAMRYANTSTLHIFSDSRYLVECATHKAVPKYHLDLWSMLYQQIEEFEKVSFQWLERNSTKHHKQAHELARIALFGGNVDRYSA